MTAYDDSNVFAKILRGEIPAHVVHEDEATLAFMDVMPAVDGHVLIIPKLHLASMADVTDEHAPLLGRMAALGPKLMKQLGVTNGFRHVINTGPDGGQEVHHLHIHVMGGPRPWLKG